MAVQSKQDDQGQVVRAEGDEQVPTYQEALSSVSVTGPSTSSQPQYLSKQRAADNHSAPPPSSNLYPFPSTSTPSAQQQQPHQSSTTSSYGQSPYQPDGTVRIVMVDSSNGQLLPLHATTLGQQQRGPRAGKRFVVAFIWAVILYTVMALVTGMMVEMVEEGRNPKTPPGWKHRHGHKDIWSSAVLAPLQMHKRLFSSA